MGIVRVIRKFGNKLLAIKRKDKYNFNFIDADFALENLMSHVNKNVVYYSNIFNERSLFHNVKLDMLDFNKIPIITKDVLRHKIKELTSKDVNNRKWRYNYSGGSVGIPTTFIQDDRYDLFKEKVLFYYFNSMLSIDYLKARKMVIWGSQRDILKKKENLRNKIIAWFENTETLNCFRISEEDLVRYVNINNSFKPDIIQGYATALYEFGKYILQKNIDIHRPKFIVAQAENLTTEMRGIIEKAFGCSVRNLYGSREVSCIAGECKNGLMHIFNFWNYVEVLDGNNMPVKEGEEGKVVVTNLHNYAMPFIRYEIGDRAIVGPKKCSCGNPYPTLKKITGRITDSFIKRDGTVIPAEFFIHFIGVVCSDGSIDKFQVIQEDHEKIKILFVSQNGLNAAKKNDIENNIRIVMGNNCAVIWEKAEDIAKTPEGKYLFVKSLVKR
jgi:phenylacetate-CoA ligase